MFEGFKARLDRLFRERDNTDARGFAARLRGALVEARAGLAQMREALAASEGELTRERKQLTDTERRGRLAAAVPDPATMAIAEQFAARHRERIEILERKIRVQRDELALAEREVDDMAARLRAGTAAPASADSIRAAWRDLETAGGSRPLTDDDRLAQDADRRRQERVVEEQLEYLKRKVGRTERGRGKGA